LIDNNLLLFDHEADSKAENVYNLSQWRVLMKGGTSDENTCTNTTDSSYEGEEESCKRPFSYIALENPMQLGCIFKAESHGKTLEIYKTFLHLETSAQ
jgi:hypothetical protein